jgi:choline/glycine/proline betaine transport protein|tara:strand:- start:706 stop:2259 length:1554 start_codon:yes stop_codon:yes gene_type:complete
MSNQTSGFLAGAHPVMAIGSALLVLGFVIFTIVDPQYAASVYNGAKSYIASELAWYYIGLMNVFLLLSLYLVFSRFGSIRLGADSDRPEFSLFAWFSMLFGAGIGIGILFYSIAEPITHFQANPFLDPALSMTPEAATIAMRLTVMHWGIHGWALYAVLGLSLAYFSYRKGLPLAIRSSLYPIFGERIYGPIGFIADLLAVIGTVFGIATSLGLGAQQMNAGLNYLMGMEIAISNQMILIAGISVVATVSVLSGVNRGIRILSVFNMRLTLLILLLFLIFGPTSYQLSSLFNNSIDYIINVPAMGIWVDPDKTSQWQGWWTIFYWGWWIAWSPFVAVFIARISRGRTLREFVLGVLLAPTGLALLWITIFGSTGMYIELFGDGGVVEAVNKDTTTALFKTIDLMNLGPWLTIIMASICTIMLVTYFVTSADSATLVICTLISMGEQEPAPRLRIFWGLAVGAVAAVLLYAGGLKALQTASIVAALPFSFVLIMAAYGLFKSLHAEPVIRPSEATTQE